MICKHAPYILTCDTFIGNTVAHSHPHHCFIKRKSGREITIFSSQTSHHTRCVSRVTCLRDGGRVAGAHAGSRRQCRYTTDTGHSSAHWAADTLATNTETRRVENLVNITQKRIFITNNPT